MYVLFRMFVFSTFLSLLSNNQIQVIMEIVRSFVTICKVSFRGTLSLVQIIWQHLTEVVYWLNCQFCSMLAPLNILFPCVTFSKKNKDGKTREQDYSSESHYRFVSPTFQYKMSHKQVGKCIIINNKNFDEKTGKIVVLYMVSLSFNS